MTDSFWFSDEQPARTKPLLPTDTRSMPQVDDRRVLSGVVHDLKSGGRWADMPRACLRGEVDAPHPVPAQG